MPLPSKEVINAFLQECRNVLERESCSFYFATVNRPENKATLTALGYNKKNVIEEIVSLSIDNYSEGPSPDKKYLADSWIFGKEISGREVYIKLQVSRFNDPGDEVQTVYCISFHFAKTALSYPYKS